MISKGKILIINDNKKILDNLTKTLAEQGFQALAAASSKEGLDILSQREIDLILLDIVMPGINGFELCKKIKAKSRTKDIPTIFITSLDGKTEKIEAFKLGAVDYITKPLITEELLARVKVHVNIKAEKEELKLNNGKKQLLLENIDTHIWYLKDVETYGQVNQAHADFFCLDKSEIAHKNIRDLYSEAEAKICIDGNKKVFEQKKKIETEEVINNCEGEDRIFSVIKTPKLNKEGNVEYAVCTAVDITEKRKAEKKLKEVKEQLRKLVEGAPGMSYQYQLLPDGTSTFPYLSEGIYKLFELEAEFVKNNPEKIFKRVDSRDIDRIHNSLAKSAKNLTVWKEEYRVNLPEQGMMWLEAKARPEKLSDGSTLWHGNTHDITARKNQEMKIKEQRDRLNWIIEGTNSGTWEWNLQTGETKFNQKYAEMLGYTLEELKANNIEISKKLIHPADLKKCKKELKKHFTGKTDSYSVETRMKHKSGDWLWILSKGKVTAWDSEGKAQKMFGINIDISEQKRHERIIKELNKVAIELQDFKDEKEICQKTIKTAREILNFDICHISLARQKHFEIAAASDKLKIRTVPLDHGVMGIAFQSNESFLTKDTEKDPEAKPTEENYKSGITIPMQDIGIFQAISAQKDDFNQRDLELAEILVVNTKAALEKLSYQKELEFKSFNDSLTDLYNRRFFEEELKRLDTKRQLPISIIMADVNGLKLINDSYGHQKGDELLIKTAEILKEVLREEDIIARMGGDEFVVLIPKTPKKQLNRIIERIKEKLELINNKEKLPLSVSFGSATKEKEAEDINQILKKADDDMYQNKLLESRSSKSNIVKGILNSLSAKSNETKEHAERMKNLALEFANKLKLSNSELNRLSLLAVMHDIGKTTISEEILTKAAKLDEKEWEIVKKHSETGYKIAFASEEFALIAEEIYSHHEHWDGNGYPRAIKGEEIPYLARIISIIDAYDVMTNERTYTKAISKEAALAEIKRCAGSQFDPELVEKFVEMMKVGC